MYSTIERFYKDIFNRLTDMNYLVNLDIVPSVSAPDNALLQKYQVEFFNELESVPEENLKLYAQSVILYIDENNLSQNRDIEEVQHKQSLFDNINYPKEENPIIRINKYEDQDNNRDSKEQSLLEREKYYHFILHVSGQRVDITNLLVACDVFVYLISEVFYKGGVYFIWTIKEMPKLINDWGFLYDLTHNLNIDEIKKKIGVYNFKGKKTQANIDDLAAFYILKWLLSLNNYETKLDKTNIAQLESFLLFREMKNDVRDSVPYKLLSNKYAKNT